MKSKEIGILDVIVGPMFSGKSEELVRRLHRFQIAKIKTKVFNHSSDVRYSKKQIASHSDLNWDANFVSKSEDILNHIKKSTDVVIIDEIQFFEDQIINVIESLLNKGINVIVAGLDTNFRGEPFGVVPWLLSVADGQVLKLRSVCAICRKWNATRTQRLLANGNPAPYSDPLIKIGALDFYQARCREHHVVPGKEY
ncbi:MAG TPA: thymidine kinase [Candidatus Nitrosocosmicus sp.]|nr:thymidine kinase [Candidatus Nitrosocosmicus sp.]